MSQLTVVLIEVQRSRRGIWVIGVECGHLIFCNMLTIFLKKKNLD